jgi:integrase
MGLGGIASVSLAEARQKALACRKAVAEGCNPLTERRSREEIPTFSETVASFLDDHRLAAWRNAKHREQWKMTLGPAYCRAILDLKVDEIKTADIVAVLRPIWATKSETASRLRGRIERVLAFAEVRGWRPEGKNPAQWRGHLDAVLPPARKLTARGHHVAMVYRDVPAFIDQLDAAPGMAALCLKFLILTAARSGEAIAARWDEIDMAQGVWTVPGSRMKAGNEHRVPLSDGVLEVLKVLEPLRQGGFVFHGRDTAKPLSAGALEMLMRRLKVKFATTGGPTVHGFRSAFRDWAGDCTNFPREIAEAALAHRVGDAVERAYRRSDALERRRSLMVAWDEYCAGNDDRKVVELATRR